MKRRHWLSKLQKTFQRRGLTGLWGKLMILQLFILLLLYFTWPPVTLTLLVPATEVTYWSALAQDFEAQNPQIRIRPIGFDNPQGDITANLKELCTLDVNQSSSLCDLIYLDIIWVPELASRGWLRNLDDKISATDLAQFTASDVAAGRYENRLYRIPFRSDFGMLYYRKDWLQQNGYAPPETFQDLLQISQDLQSQGIAEWGYLWQGQQEGLISTFIEVLQGHGGFWIDPETSAVGLDNPEAIAAVNFLRETIATGISPSLLDPLNEEESFTAFQQGNAIFLRNWPYVFRRATAAASPLRDKVARMPMNLHIEGQTGAGCKGSWGLGIARRSRHVQQAWKAIQYFTSETAQQQFMQETSYIPSRKTLLQKNPTLQTAVETAILRPPIPEYAQASLILQDYLSKALRGQFEVDIAMRAAADKTRNLLSKQ